MTVSEKVQLYNVCVGKSSNIALNKIKVLEGSYPLYGASGFIQNVDFYNQEKEYIGIVKDGAGVGRVVVLPPKSSVLGTMQYILPKDNISIRYLFYQLCNLKLERYASGATIPHIYFKDYSKEIIHLPSLQEQKEIAKTLDKASELVALRKKQLVELDNLAESVFYDMFGNLVSNKKGWKVKNIMNVCEKITDGPFGSNLKTSDYKEYGVRVIRLENIGVLKFNDGLKSFISEEKYEKLIRYTVKKEDIIFSSFVIDKIRVSLIPNTLDKAINKADCFLVRPNNSKINKYYLVYYLASDSMHNQIYDKIHGQTRPRVNTTQLKQTQIPLPPLSLQNKFATIVDKIEEQRSEVKKALLESEDLFQRLMQDLLNPD